MVATKPQCQKKSQISQGRRNLLSRGVQWIGGLLAATVLYPLLRFTGHKIPAKPRIVEVAAPLPLSGVHVHHDFLLFAGQGEQRPPHAVSRICTHLGCRVNYQEDKQRIECPCHQSRFTPQGVRLSGPAEKNLPSYEVSLKKDVEGRTTTYVVRL